MVGQPIPDITWTYKDIDLFKTARATLKYKNDISKLIVKNANRADCGEYTIKATNNLGTVEKSATLVVLGKNTISYLKWV